jgi:hypothetical protein
MPLEEAIFRIHMNNFLPDHGKFVKTTRLCRRIRSGERIVALENNDTAWNEIDRLRVKKAWQIVKESADEW